MEITIGGFPYPVEPVPQYLYTGGGNLFPNADNAYISTTVNNDDDKYLLITGIAPTFPNTNEQAIVQDPPTDIRYWSLCTNVAESPGHVVDGGDDQHTQTFPASLRTLIPLQTQLLFINSTFRSPDIPTNATQFFYIISQRRPAALDSDVTLLHFYNDIHEKNARFYNLIYRHMDANADFLEAIPQIPING